MLSSFDIDELSDFLLDEGVDVGTVKEFQRNKICGKAFLNLAEEDLKELIPLIGVRATIRDILNKVSQEDEEDIVTDWSVCSLQEKEKYSSQTLKVRIY